MEPKKFLFHMVPDPKEPSTLDVEVVIPLWIVREAASSLGMEGWKGKHVMITETDRPVTFNATWIVLSSLPPVLQLRVRQDVGLPKPSEKALARMVRDAD